MSRIKVTAEDRKIILGDALLPAVSTFRRLTGWGLADSHGAIKALREDPMKFDKYFEPADPCPHCGGTGFAF